MIAEIVIIKSPVCGKFEIRISKHLKKNYKAATSLIPASAPLLLLRASLFVCTAEFAALRGSAQLCSVLP